MEKQGDSVPQRTWTCVLRLWEPAVQAGVREQTCGLEDPLASGKDR